MKMGVDGTGPGSVPMSVYGISGIKPGDLPLKVES